MCMCVSLCVCVSRRHFLQAYPHIPDFSWQLHSDSLLPSGRAVACHGLCHGGRRSGSTAAAAGRLELRWQPSFLSASNDYFAKHNSSTYQLQANNHHEFWCAKARHKFWMPWNIDNQRRYDDLIAIYIYIHIYVCVHKKIHTYIYTYSIVGIHTY